MLPPLPASGYQVENQDDQRHNQQKVDQTPGDMKAETEKPHDQENHHYRPKHIRLLSAHREHPRPDISLGCTRAF